MVRARPWFLALTLATAGGCGDGIGRPILGDGSAAVAVGGAGAAGVTGMGGGAGSSGAPSGGAGAGGTAGAGAGAGAGAAAGAGGMAGSDPSGGLGGKEREPPPGGGLAPPWEEGRGGSRSGGGGSSGLPPPGDVPPGSYCAEVADWDPGAVGAEWVLYDHLNFARRAGFVCGTGGAGSPPSGDPVDPVIMDPALRCAARLNSKALSEGRNSGVGPEDRMRNAGAVFLVASESVDQVPPPSGEPMPPYDPILAIFAVGGSRCENLLDPRFDSVGIGVYRDFVTLDFSGR